MKLRTWSGTCWGSRLGAIAVSTAFAAALITAVPAVSQEVAVRQVSLSKEQRAKLVVNPGMIWTLEFDKPYANIAIGNVAILDAYPLTKNSAYLQTKQAGTTNIALYDEQDIFLGEVNIQVSVNQGEQTLQDLINDAVPGANVTVSILNNQIYLTGDVLNPDDVPIVLDIAQTYSAETALLAYSLSSQENINPKTNISVIRNGGTTPYVVPVVGGEVSQVKILKYGTIQARTGTVEEEEEQSPVIVNINTGDNQDDTADNP